MSEIKKEYTNGELAVIWKPRLCIHASECVKNLPNVYKPEERPWIQAENGTTEELKAQIRKCPSGALTYRMLDGSDEWSGPGGSTSTNIEAEVIAGGPFDCKG